MSIRMKYQHVVGLGTCCALVIMASCATGRNGESAPRSKPEESADKYETPGPRDTMSAVMQAKLAHAQGILEGIALADFRQIETNADGLHRISMQADWLVHDTASYYAFSDRFREATLRLVGHAREKNLDAVSRDYARLTETCVACHTWLRAEGLTKDLPGRVSMLR